MTENEWKEICDDVNNQMIRHVRPYITPLFKSSIQPRSLVGSGSFIRTGKTQSILTCEHVIRGKEMDFILSGNQTPYGIGHSLASYPEPIDLELASIKPGNWLNVVHNSKSICESQISRRHAPYCKEEILFIQGFAFENSGLGHGDEIPISTGLATQQKSTGSSDEKIFELFWEPNKMNYSSETDEQTQNIHRHIDPRGISGSLVWDTKFLECTAQKINWSPAYSTVTGIVQRWDSTTASLICLRSEWLLPLLSNAGEKN